MRIRLRPTYSPEELEKIYSAQYNHTQWTEHVIRQKVMLAMTEQFGRLYRVADLSCGDGWLIDNIDAVTRYKGDFVPGYKFTGPIEETIDRMRHVNLFILSETLEHLDDPDLVLKKIREKSDAILLSTPIGEDDPAINPEHYWGWDTDDVREMLVTAGFEPVIHNSLYFPLSTYDFQIWGAR